MFILSFLLQISSREANVSLGGIIVAASRAEIFSMSYAYVYGSLVYAIPSGKPYSSFEKLFFPFKYIIWSCICALFVIATILLVALKCFPKKMRNFLLGKSNNMPLFNMYNICLGGTVSMRDIPLRNFARTLLLIWLLATLVLRNAYQGKLFDNLRSHQRAAPYFNLDELYASELKLYLYESFFQNVADVVKDEDNR